jgi:hypothetical protein
MTRATLQAQIHAEDVQQMLSGRPRLASVGRHAQMRGVAIDQNRQIRIRNTEAPTQSTAATCALSAERSSKLLGLSSPRDFQWRRSQMVPRHLAPL